MHHKRVRALVDQAKSARALNYRHVPLRLTQLKDSLLAQLALAPEQTLL